jgi:hypothetical protein
MKTQKGVLGFCTTIANSNVGITSSSADTIVQLRPPNFGTAKVYGNRSSEPTRFGIATSQNNCCGLKLKPCLVSSAALTLHSSQTEKPRCSAMMEKNRLRWAIGLPVDSQNSGFSGSQWSIQPLRDPVDAEPTGASASGSAGLSVTDIGTPHGPGPVGGP